MALFSLFFLNVRAFFFGACFVHTSTMHVYFLKVIIFTPCRILMNGRVCSYLVAIWRMTFEALNNSCWFVLKQSFINNYIIERL